MQPDRCATFLAISVALTVAAVTGCDHGAGGDTGATDAGRDAPASDGDAPDGDQVDAPPSCDADGDGVDAIACGGTDCDDADRDRFPGNAERCDAADPGHDEDCNPCTIVSASTNDGDHDLDGYPSATCTNAYTAGPPTCDAATTRVDAAGMHITGADCDDGNASVRPSQPEACNGVDDNCNGTTDEGVLLGFYPDADHDGFGDARATATPACMASGDLVEDHSDCDDTNASRNPTTSELCNGIDDNCNGMIDEGATTPFYPDVDADGHGDGTAAVPGDGCTAPAGFVTTGDDCDDTSSVVHTGAPETCDGIDDDCSSGGGADPSEDGDGDRHSPPGAACVGGFPQDDCDDGYALAFTGAPELCDGHDDDCDGAIDELPDATAFCGARASCDAGVCHDDVGVAAGATHTCALRATGTVLCWGNDTSGQIGDGDAPWPPPSGAMWQPVPVPVLGLSDAVEVASGSMHSCARRRSGGVVCWGAGSSGQLGDGDAMTSTRGSPAPVSGLVDAVQLALGAAHSCARRLGGTVVCWGDDAHGELGDGSATNRASPVAVGGITDAVEIAAGAEHTCARLRAGPVVCWGRNANGELGDGTTTDRAVPVMVGGLVDAVQLAAGAAFTCARRATGVVVCWGAGTHGQLGDGPVVDRSTPGPVSGLGDAADLAASGLHVCALRAGGTVACWGDNENGELGDGTLTRRSTPVAVVGLTGAVGLAAGATLAGFTRDCPGVGTIAETCGNLVDDNCDGEVDEGCAEHTCARLTSGAVVCWGGGSYGELGDDSHTTTAHGASVPAPTAVESLADAVEVATGYDYTCARRATGAVACWGLNSSGQLGDGTTATRVVPVPVAGVSGAHGVTAGGGHACAIDATGGVVCWGGNDVGELGDGVASHSVCTIPAYGYSFDCSPTPVSVVGLASVVQVAAGGTGWYSGNDFTCALDTAGSVACWGANGRGQLGDGTSTSRATPVVVPGLSGVVEIAVGPRHACARLSTGALRCWGANESAQLGDGTYVDAASPVGVVGVTDALSIGVASAHTCAARASSRVSCWGYNFDYQLGNGVFSDSESAPVDVVGVTDALQAAGGYTHTCAMHATGAVSCWGRSVGYVGDGTFYERDTPVAAVGVTDAIALRAYGDHSCVLRAGGGVQCWGENADGELGTGAYGTDRIHPYTVPGLP